VTTTTLEATVAANLAAVRARIERAARAVGRDPARIRLVAVSKTFGPDYIRAAYAAGQRDFGENRVQEALQKIDQTADLPIVWHLVGHLQSNKARKAAKAFSWIHSVDSLRLLAKLDADAEAQGVRPTVLVQVDLAGEPTKYGVPREQVAELFDAAARCRAVQVRGLMVLPPYTPDPEGARPYFRALRELAAELETQGVDPALLQELSMGMSHDLDIAVQEGATVVRVGTAIFGSRAAAGPGG
jgi:pyridoxal phosphate enzyme (YggS family)